MKLVKSLLLGSAAGLAAVAGAQAADLPAKKAAPVEYVKVCSTYGAGFFYIPGTDTCLRVSGRVRADYLYNTPQTRADDVTGFRTRGRIQLDARTATAYGLLRSVVRFEITRNSGTALSSTGTVASPEGADVAEAFVQFGGLTAGRVTSFFTNSDLPTGHFTTLRFDDAPDVDLLAYTFTFGNGFSASLAVEDGLERRYNDRFSGSDVATALNYAGQRMPDLVGNIKYTGTWGTAQLSGAVHQIRSLNTYTVGNFSTFADTEYGFSIAASAGINLPSLAPGDALWIDATYADGALAYLSGGNGSLNTGPRTDISRAGVVGFTDAYYDPITGDIKRGRGWALAGGFRHYLTPQLRTNIFGSYVRVDYSGSGSFVNDGGFNTGVVDFNEWRLGGNLIWQPVSGLDLGVEAVYVRLDPRGRVLVPTAGTIGSDNALETRLRIQRDF